MPISLLFFSLLLLSLSLPLLASSLPVINICAATTLAAEERLLNASYDGALALEGRQLLQGWTLWAELLNARGGILVAGVPHLVNLTVANHGGSDPARVAALYAAFLDGTYLPGLYCHFLFAPWSSILTVAAARVVEAAQPPRTMIAMHAAAEDTWKCASSLPPPCTQTGRRRFRYSWGGTPTSDSILVPAVELLRVKNPQTLASFDFGIPFSRSMVRGAVYAAQSNGISVVGQLSYDVLTPSPAAFDALVQQMAAWDPDIVVGGTYLASCVEFIRACERQRYFPRAALVSLCTSRPDFKNLTGDSGRYFIDFLTWHPQVKGPDYEERLAFNLTKKSISQILYHDNHFKTKHHMTPREYEDATYFTYFPVQRNADGTINTSSPQVFADAYFARWGEMPIDPMGNAAVISGYVLEWAVQNAQSLDTEAVQLVLPQISESSFYGRLAFDSFGRNDKKATLVTQTDIRNDIRIVFPNSALQMEVIYPIPTWDEREPSGGYYQTGSEVALTVITAVNMAHSCCWLLVVFLLRDRVAFRAAQSHFLYVFLLGGVVALSGVFTWQLYVTQAGCAALPWLFGMGFTMMAATVVVRLVRIYQILYASKQLRKVKPRLRTGMLGLSCFCAVSAVILVVWSAAFPLQAVRVVPDPLRPSTSYWVCDAGTGATALLIVLLAWSGVVTLLAAVFGFLLRNFDRTLFNESRPLAFVAYNFCILGSLIVGLQAGDVGDREAQFVIRSALINIVVFLAVGFLLFPKIWLLKIKDIHHNSTSMEQAPHHYPTDITLDSTQAPLFIQLPPGKSAACPNCAIHLINRT